MIHTLLDVAISPIEIFAYEIRNSYLPIVLVVVGVLAIAALTYFFIRYKDNEDSHDNEENKEE